MATNLIVKCKCSAARVVHCYQSNPDGTAFLETATSWSPWAKCWTCDATIKRAEIHGRRTGHKCDARCLESTGHKCECSCGGRNHGAAYC
jgi:hypothetical protein